MNDVIAREALMLLHRSEMELDMRIDLRERAVTSIAARLEGGESIRGVAFAEVLARASGLLLLGHHRSDQEAATVEHRQPVTLDPMLADAVADATTAMRQKQWEKYDGERRPYDPKKAARKYEAQQFDPWNALWIAAQQSNIYSLLITDTGSVTTHVYIAGETQRKSLCSLLREHAHKSAYEISLLGLLAHFEALTPGKKADQAVYAHIEERIKRHEAKFRQRCAEKGWEYQPTLQFEPCGHYDRIAGEHSSECYFKMADLLECVSDYYLHPALYRHKWRGAEMMRHLGKKDPNALHAKSCLNLMAFFGPEGRVRVAQAVGYVLSQRQ